MPVMLCFALLYCTSAMDEVTPPCYRGCPPWEVCSTVCSRRPWNQLPEYEQQLIDDADYLMKMAKYYQDSNTSVEYKYLACPPWFNLCTGELKNVPWYDQPEWKEKLLNDSEFAKTAAPYLKLPPMEYDADGKVGDAEPTENSVAQRKKPCYRICAPWEKCDETKCSDEPFFDRESTQERIKADPVFRRKALEYVATAPKEDTTRQDVIVFE